MFIKKEENKEMKKMKYKMKIKTAVYGGFTRVEDVYDSLADCLKAISDYFCEREELQYITDKDLPDHNVAEKLRVDIERTE